MFEHLKLLLEIAANYLTDAEWPPVKLVEQIAAEAKRVEVKPPIEYRLIQSAEDSVGTLRPYFAEEPETLSVIEYRVRDPFNGIHNGIAKWYKKTSCFQSASTDSTPDIEVIQAIPVIKNPPGKHVVLAMKVWVKYLESREQSQVPVLPAPDITPMPDSSLTRWTAAKELMDQHSFVAAVLTIASGGRVTAQQVSQIITIATSCRTINEKLFEIDAILAIPKTASASALARLLECSASAVKKTSWWKEHRQGYRKGHGIQHRKTSDPSGDENT